MNHIVKADGGGEMLLWLVVGIFWVIAQIAGAGKRKARPGQREAQREELNRIAREGEAEAERNEETDIDPFSDLMRKLAGEQPRPVPVQPVREKPKPIPPPPSTGTQHAPAPKPATRLPRSELRSATGVEPAKTEAIDVEAPAKQKGSSLAMPSMKLPLIRAGFQSIDQSGAGFPRIIRELDLTGRNALRRAMLSHIIFEKPKGLI